MKLKTLHSFLRKEISAPDFYSMLRPKVAEYVRDRGKVGSSNPVHVEDISELNEDQFTKVQFIELLETYLEEKLGEWDLEYVLN